MQIIIDRATCAIRIVFEEAAPPAEQAALDERAAVAEAEATVAGLRELLQYQAAISADARAAAEAQAQAQALVENLPPAPSYEEREVRVHSTVPFSVAQKMRAVLAAEPLFLDYETTGLRRGVQAREVGGGYTTTASAKYHQVIEAAVMDAKGRLVFHSRVNPQRGIPARISETNGLDPTSVAAAPTWGEVAPLLKQILQGRTVVAHNAAFDALFTPPEWGIEWVCTKALADEAFGRYDWFEAQHDRRKSGRLADRLWQCGLKPGPAHTAAGDCESVLRLARYLAGLKQQS
ncbi:MAG: 3'-5' exonuclease [Anaerolineae bacterium]|nr:3'-5' exonuclease [Anaerolineae bacterium]